MGIQPLEGGVGHAVCVVGRRLGNLQGQIEPGVTFLDGAAAVQRIYVHDDRLGPYAAAELRSAGDGETGTLLSIRWPDDEVAEESRLRAMLIPVPLKLRLSAGRLRALGYRIANAVASVVPSVAVVTRFAGGADYRTRAFEFELSREGLRELIGALVLSKWIGVIEVSWEYGPLVDVVLDATETNANPAVLAVVRREGAPQSWTPEGFAEALGARAVS